MKKLFSLVLLTFAMLLSSSVIASQPKAEEIIGKWQVHPEYVSKILGDVPQEMGVAQMECSFEFCDNAMLSFQLGQVESIIKEQLSYSNHSFVRVGKSLIINIDELICVNITKQMLEINQPSGERLLFNASREALKKLMNFLIENKKNGMVRNINMRPVQTRGSGMLRGYKQMMIDDNDIRLICDY